MKNLKFISGIITAAVVIAVIAGVLIYAPKAKPVITTFEECAALYPVMESYPEQCNTPDGKHFVRNISGDFSDVVRVDSPKPGALVTSPLKVTGSAPGFWFGEANIPVLLLDADGKTVAQVGGSALGEWMTTSTVPFTAMLTFFDQPKTKTGTLVIHNDNASGDPARDKEFRVPIQFGSLPKPVSAAFGAPISIAVYQAAQFPDGLRVILNGINDSRCKPGVQCIWQGELQAIATIDKGNVTDVSYAIAIGTVNNKSITQYGYTFTLQGATPTSATITVTKGVVSNGITGYVHAGPTCPVEKYPPDPNCADRPVAGGNILVRIYGSNTLAGETTTDNSGHFKLTLPPGLYTVMAGKGANFPRCPETDVRVTTGTLMDLDISCDSGIR